ncbi:amidase [Amorphus sp. 3PC139-8]|uniref:amidase n=1 Tax=Amorphus sp. 3PC139-8 TaxID=2735676 RepID=UPI00345C9E10
MTANGQAIDPTTLSAAEISAKVRSGALSCEQVVRARLDRIAAREGDVRAWAEIDEDQAIAAARTVDAAGPRGLLAGVPIGVKDVIDTSDLPTRYGSPIYDSHRPAADASCVALARLEGALVLGKTVTAEFAGVEPTRTRNPLNLAHTPGGSSSGSAAAVADHMVPVAYGTQTGGSVLRPASFCGVIGFKPTFGLYNPAGVKPAAESFDTVGLIARTVEDISLFHAVLTHTEPVPARASFSGLRIGIFRTHLWDSVLPETAALFERRSARLAAAGAHLVDVAIPEGFETITEHRATINAYERAHGLAHEWRAHRDLLTRYSVAVCERGFAIDGETYLGSRIAVDALRSKVRSLFADIDLLLTPTVPGEAPEGHDYAGDPRLQELWTMLHCPAITLPAGHGPNGLPIGLQLVAPQYADATLLSAAGAVAESLRT